MEKYLWGGIFSEIREERDIKRFIDSFQFDRILCRENFDVTLTHAIALSELGMIRREKVRRMLELKEKIIDAVANAKEDEFEDVHSAIEFFISEYADQETGFNLRLGRSRNEEVITTTYLWVLRKSSELHDMFLRISESILECAERNFGKVIPLFTHERQAQPILFSHLLLSYHEGFIRNVERFRDCLTRFDVCHLGSGAGAGTGVDLNIELMARILGFSKTSQNSIDSTGRRDTLTELIFVFSMMSLLFSRISDDLIMLSSENLNFVQLSDSLCTGSSMMPQKKNPDTLEVMRSKFAKFSGYLNSMMMLEKGLISGYSKDLQEDKRILFQAFHEITDVLRVIDEVFRKTEAAEGRILNHTLATDLAEQLVLSKKMTYREAHRYVGERLKRGEKLDLTVEESLRMKRTPQSTNPEFVRKQISSHRNRFSKISAEIKAVLEKFQETEFTKRVRAHLL